MPNPYFRFKQFTVFHDRCAMKVTTDACLFGAWCAAQLADRKVVNALDIGAGTGLLSLMIAQKTTFRIDAVELDSQAAEQAATNIAASPWPDQINVIHHDVLEFIPQKQYDVIISNPPFYEDEITSTNAGRNLAHHGSGLRLDSLLYKINELLLPDGDLFLLLPAKRQSDIFKMLLYNGFHILEEVKVYPKPDSQAFRLLLHVSKKTKHGPLKTAMSIQDKAGNYSSQFKGLLKDYYLYL